MIIGEAPGADEDEEGEPFIGRSGQLLNRMLKSAGWKREDVYVTNAVHCRPPDNRTPSKREITVCREWLMKEVADVNPKFIMTMGNIPLQSLLGLKGIKNLRGKPIEVPGQQFGLDHPVVYVFPVYHPSYALRDPRNEPVLERDIAQFFNIVKRGAPRFEKGLNRRIVLTPQEYDEAVADIAASDVLSWDTETSGLDAFAAGAWMTSFGVGTENAQWCFPLNHQQSPFLNKVKVQKRKVKKIARAMKGKLIVTQNGKFDTIFTRELFGETIYTDFDTMLAHYNLDENAYHGLDHLAAEYFGAIDYDIPLSEKQGFGPLDRHCDYLALDLYYTRKLYYVLKSELEDDPSTEKLFYHLTMPVARMYADIEYTGVYVNPHKLEAAHVYWEDKADEVLRMLNHYVPSNAQRKDKKTKQIITGVNWGSPQQVGEVLFDKLKLSPLDKTPKGQPSVSESVLLRLADQHPVPKLIIEYREAMKNKGTFVEGWQARCYNYRMHPHFKVHGTVTGRPSCEEPNLQQTPRDPRIRSLIEEIKEDENGHEWVLVDADLSQAELRFTAEDSGDRELKLCYQTGVDVHTRTVQHIFNIMKPSKEERKKGKAINFGFVYGMWWKKFKTYALDNYGVVFTDKESEAIRKKFFRLYSGLTDWHKRKKTFARMHGYVMSMIGRKRRLPDAMIRRPKNKHEEMRQQEAERQAVNSPIQSLASDWTLAAAVELHETLPQEYFRIVGSVHDAVLMGVRKDKLMEVLPRIKQAMEHPAIIFDKFKIKISVPIESEIEIGPWGAPTHKFEKGQLIHV
jgi:uracil-DNA glycosylase family 4